MRRLTDHNVSVDQAVQLQIEVTDEPGADGANHAYVICWDDGHFAVPQKSETYISFQKGPIKEAGVNGITQEALLAIIIDRLRSYQNGPYKCHENAIALTHCEEALMWLQRRTIARIKRGVEGTHEK